MVRTRIAPSPTGIPHVGNTRTALFNFLFARHNKGNFILRIEDTDQKRIVPGAKEAIFEILEWLEIPPDEIYIQSERLEIYKKHIKTLLGKGIAYEKEGATWIKVDKKRDFSWSDAIGKKNISFKGESIEDFVAIKSDGFPTYHFASVVDDHLMEISHVIRGDEWISSTPKHIFLYESFEWKKPIFAHLPVILGTDRAKLSKRHGAKSVLEFRDEGYMREALLNFMALLGWSPGKDREIMDISTMVELFDLSDVNTNSPIFDIKKLEWMNGEYIRKLSISNFKFQISNFYNNKYSQKLVEKLFPLLRERMGTLKDFEALAKHFFESPDIAVRNKIEREIAQDLYKKLENTPWNKNSIMNSFREILTSKKVRMPVLYYLLTGSDKGLPLPESVEILGREKILSRLKKLI